MYSCALWKSTADGGEEESLAEAQIRKVHNIIDKAKIKKEHHVLDIGGGWAFLAIETVKKTGCKVTATTLSVEQKALGEQRVKDAGLEDRIEVSGIMARKNAFLTPCTRFCSVTTVKLQCQKVGMIASSALKCLSMLESNTWMVTLLQSTLCSIPQMESW